MKRALVIVDMQNDFVTGALGNAQCEAVVPEILQILKEESYDDIYLTRDTHQADYFQTQEGRNLPVLHCVEGSEGWQVVSEIAQAVPEDAMYIDKPAFGSITLAQTVKDKYDEVVLTGVCTGICVISNALLIKAFSPEMKICVKERATACVSPESKKTALEAMKLCQINIISQ